MQDAAAVLREFLNCRYKAFLKLKGETGVPSKYAELQATLGAEFRERARTLLSKGHLTSAIHPRPDSIQQVFALDGLYFDVPASDGNGCWTFDAIESYTPKGASGVRIVKLLRFAQSVELTTNDKILAAADGLRLAALTGEAVEQVCVVHGLGPTITKLKLVTKSGQTRMAAEAKESLASLATMIQDASSEPKLILNSHCELCEFRQRCRVEAERRDDLSLLKGLHPPDIEALNARGVFTVTQLAYTCRPRSIGRNKSALKKHSIPLQAMAVRDKTVYVRKLPELPRTAVKMYMDVESVPGRSFHYLIGLLIDRPEAPEVRQFWADSEKDEETIWSSLQNELTAAGDCTVFHFGRFESEFIDLMQQRYGPQGEMSLHARLCDVHAMIRTNVFFPTYSNGLKPIATELGAAWTSPITSGLDSIVWRRRWEREHDASLKDELLQYNMEDCAALKTVTEFLQRLDSPGEESGLSVKATDRIPNSSFNFGQGRYATPDLARFTKCAYFSYQRDRIHIRTEKRVRRSASRKRRERQTKTSVGQRIDCAPATECPKCGATQIVAQTRIRSKRIVHELKFTARGVKRCDVEHTAIRHQCSSCRSTFFPAEYSNRTKFGYSIAAWAVYQQIALRQTGYAITENFHDLFGLLVTPTTVGKLRRTLATFHEKTESSLLQRLRDGNLICADEAKLEIRKATGYVWVFSNTEEVLYRFSPSREGRIVEEVLGEFDGIIVSDFYGAYDIPEFKQQKCLVHLIRDINDDLLKSPFNEELKALAERFTALLKPIIETVDQYGLKQRHLRKFVAKSANFLQWIANNRFETQPARGYQKRFQKYGPRMFTFLSHDGIPWNNNLAENAVKLIACRRATLGVSFSAEGIQDYLRFLSIYQTLRRKGGNFLRFLLSKQTNISAFLRE